MLAVGTLVFSALTAGPALAERRVRLQSTGSETCSGDPNPVSNDVPGWFSVSGSGFMPGLSLDVFVVSPSGGIGILMTTALSDGSFHTASLYAPFLLEDGQWSAYVYQEGDKRMTPLASCPFTVN